MDVHDIETLRRTGFQGGFQIARVGAVQSAVDDLHAGSTAAHQRRRLFEKFRVGFRIRRFLPEPQQVRLVENFDVTHLPAIAFGALPEEGEKLLRVPGDRSSPRRRLVAADGEEDFDAGWFRQLEHPVRNPEIPFSLPRLNNFPGDGDPDRPQPQLAKDAELLLGIAELAPAEMGADTVRRLRRREKKAEAEYDRCERSSKQSHETISFQNLIQLRF